MAINEVVTKAAIAELFKTINTQSSSMLGILKEEYEQFTKLGISKYLERNRQKFIKTKTLLHRTTLVNFYDIYQPTILKCGRKSISTSSINTIFSESTYITIIGDAGSGKSTLIKHLFLNSIKEHFNIPIIIELRYLNDFEGTIEDFIYQKICENRIASSNRIIEKFLENGTFVFFF